MHAPELACAHDSKALLQALSADIETHQKSLGKHRSGRHFQIYGDALITSSVFAETVGRILHAFGLTLVDCWVNVYRHGADMKYWHQDNYNTRQPVPTVTLGLSLGETRDLAFHHVGSGKEFRIPQKNGDVFAFDNEFNSHFKHSIPPVPKNLAAERMSIIIWATEQPITQPVLRMWPDHHGMPDSVPRVVSWRSLHMMNSPPPNQKKLQHILVGQASPNSNSATAVSNLQAHHKQGVRRRHCIKRHSAAAACFQFENSLVARLVTMLGFLRGYNLFHVDRGIRANPATAVGNERCGLTRGCTHHPPGLHIPLVHVRLSCGYIQSLLL